jgi:alpha-L-fucosidase
MNAIDGLSDKGFETCWSTWSLALPQAITIDLGGVWSEVSTLEYLPKQWSRTGSTDGDITSYAIETSTDGITFTQVASGSWAGDATTKVTEWPGRNVGLVRVTVTAGTGGYANISELRIGGRSARPGLVASFPGPGTVYRLVARHSGKVVDVSGAGTANGTNILQWPWLNQTNQKWTFTPTGDGYFKIRDSHSGKLLEVAGLSRANAGNVGLWSDDDVPQQHWAVTPIAGGFYVLTNRLSGLCMEVSGASTADGANIDQWTYAMGAAHQEWQLVAS